jgi:hypothetical protein
MKLRVYSDGTIRRRGRMLRKLGKLRVGGSKHRLSGLEAVSGGWSRNCTERNWFIEEIVEEL